MDLKKISRFIRQVIACCLPLFLYAEKALPPEAPFPWLTGPLLTPSANVVPRGHVNIEPYLYATSSVGRYDSHWHAHSSSTRLALTWQLPVQIGLTSWLDTELIPSYTYNHVSGSSAWAFNDLTLLFDIQLISESSQPGEWRPALKFTLGETFPTGAYQHLNSQLTDLGGQGSYTSFIELTLGKLIQFSTPHFLNVRLSILYEIPTHVHVQGFNSYGGGAHTNGTVSPGRTLSLFGACEYTLTQQWAIACDLVGSWTTTTHFSGTLGPNASFTNLASSTQISLAPALEYNWSDALGLIIGPWITLTGRNATQFYSGVIAVNYYF